MPDPNAMVGRPARSARNHGCHSGSTQRARYTPTAIHPQFEHYRTTLRRGIPFAPEPIKLAIF
eukprot:11210746-Lingulodinium_polyedra.AAC.1